MVLTPSNLVHYLSARGLVPLEEIVAGNLRIVEAGRRNRNFKVRLSGARGYFVKQVRERTALNISVLQREAAWSRWACQPAPPAGVDGVVPQFVAYDPPAHVLVTELLIDAEDLDEHCSRSGRIPTGLARAIGRALGAFHARAERPPFFAAPAPPPAAPPVLWAHRQAISPSWNPFEAHLREMIRRFPAFSQLLDELARSWRPDGIIHGDLRWNNVVVPDGAGKLAFRFVDWELVDYGDTGWDLGALFQNFLARWILSLPSHSSADPDALERSARHRLETMYPAIHALWHGYITGRGMNHKAAEDFLLHSVRLAAGRLVLSAFEAVHFSAAYAPWAPLMLQVSWNILGNPRAAATDLLRLLPKGSPVPAAAPTH